jgi:glycosyltransferase involved in cell wall biosynthesis
MMQTPIAPGPLRIAYVINSMEGGGAASPLPAIVATLRRCGAAVRIFALTRRDGRGLAALQAEGISVMVRRGGERDHLRALLWLRAELRDWQPTHIWTSLTRATLLGQLVGRCLSVPVASWQHAAYLKPANRRLLRLTRKLSFLWIADSASVAALTAERLRVPDDRLAVWPIFRADADAPRASGWRPGETFRIGSLGRLHKVKGYDVLIEAAAMLKEMGLEFELVIAGEGGERDALAAQAKAARLDEVRFPGFAANPGDFLAGLHLYVQPSRSEGFCIAAHEAMQAAVPVVASAVGELALSITPGVTGELVQPGSAEALALAVARMIADPVRAEGMGARAREMVLDRFRGDRFEAAGQMALARFLLLGGGPKAGASRGAPRSPDRGGPASWI